MSAGLAGAAIGARAALLAGGDPGALADRGPGFPALAGAVDRSAAALDGVAGTAASIVEALGEVSLAVAVTVIAAALADLALRRTRWPELRAVPWLLVLLRCALPPGFASPGSVIGAARDGLGSPALAGSASSLAAPLATTAPGAGAVPTSGAAIADLVLASLWIAGALLLGAGALVRHRRTRAALLGRALPTLPAPWRSAADLAAAQLGLARPPRIAAVPGLDGPLILGALRPVVLVPARLPGGDAARREHVLLHEFAHAKRRDPLLGGVSAALQVIFWFHPLVWLARRRLARIVELCADAEVARALGPATPEYRGTLLDAAGRRAGLLPAGALGFVSRRASIIERLRALERPANARRGARRAVGMLVALVLAATVLPARGTAGSAGPDSPRSDTRLAARVDVPPDAPDHPGCLVHRYTVLGALAAEEGAPAAPPGSRN